MILASGSPQRRAILTQLGIEFDVAVPEVVELDGQGPAAAGGPDRLVVENALLKARSVAGSSIASGRLVLGADTAVVVDGRVYGKPSDEAEAATVLRLLSGREHEVHSGIAVIDGGVEQTASARTRVRFRLLDEGLLSWYLASGEWRGRAGAYAIQARGAALVDEVSGDYLNVVGLPVAELLRLRPDLLTS